MDFACIKYEVGQHCFDQPFLIFQYHENYQ